MLILIISQFGTTNISYTRINSYADWMERNMISDWRNGYCSRGCLLSYQRFCIQHNLNSRVSKFKQLCKVLPKLFLFLIKNIVNIHPQLSPLSKQGMPLILLEYISQRIFFQVNKKTKKKRRKTYSLLIERGYNSLHNAWGIVPV